MASVGVQTILLVEDSIRFYSSALPHIYHIVLEQSRIFAEEALNDHLKMLRMRGRPKVMLARSFEEATDILHTYPDNILGVVSDMSFTHHGKKDALAGYLLGQYIKQLDPHIPVILESSELNNKRYADELGMPFLAKKSKSYPQDLQREIMTHFGFGDFVISDPKTHEELFRIKDLKDLQKKIFLIPDDALRYHLQHNHFSRFFYSRAMFPPAEILKAHDVGQYADMNEARHNIFNLIVSYRRMKNEGVVAIYRKDRFDEYSNFARIGNGSLGGKGRGLAFMGNMAKQSTLITEGHLNVDIPRTVVICTDIFDKFMEANNLYPIALSNAADNEILDAFERASLPDEVLDDLMSLFDVVKGPIAVRSSSLLEDSHYQPFAGVYSTYMIPHVDEREEMVRLLRSAVKAVYASVFYADSKAYLTATQNLIDQEKMAVVLQEVVGEAHEGLFYPFLSGVARSLNFYPVGGERTEDGIATVALGLGKHIVDGAPSLRFAPSRPRHIIQLTNPQTALRDTQRNFLALDLNNQPTTFMTNDAFNLRKVNLSDAPASDSSLRKVFSTYDLQNDRLVPGMPLGVRGRRLVTFSGILSADGYALPKTISRVLENGTKEMGRPVEIEFALHTEGEETTFFLLQIRPIVDISEDTSANFEPSADEKVIVRSNAVLGNGTVDNVCDIVYIKDGVFGMENNRRIAEELRELNAQMSDEGRTYVLLGPGRWGSSDVCLGIPVSWPQISMAAVIAETTLPGHDIEPSQGTHFFQNVTSLGIGYFTLSSQDSSAVLTQEWLDRQPSFHETSFLRAVHFQSPLHIRLDGRHHRGIVSL